MKRHSIEQSHLYISDRLIRSLRSDERHEAKELQKKLIQCEDPSKWSGRYECHSPACPRCRDRHIGKERRKLQARYRETPAADLGLFSVILGVTAPDDIADIGTIWRDGIDALGKHLASQRRRDPAWQAVELTMWLEIDCIAVDDIPLLGRDKRRQINEMRLIPADASGTVWVITGHGILKTGPYLSVDEVQISLEPMYPFFHQLQIEPFSNTKIVHLSVGDIVNYALKSKFETTVIENHSFFWDTKQVLEYSIWIDSFSRGFQSLKMTSGLKTRSSIQFSTSKNDDIGGNTTPLYTASTLDEVTFRQPNTTKYAFRFLLNTMRYQRRSEKMLGFYEWMHKSEIEEPQQALSHLRDEAVDLFEVVPIAADTPLPSRIPFKATRTMKDVFAYKNQVTSKASPTLPVQTLTNPIQVRQRLTMNDVFSKTNM